MTNFACPKCGASVPADDVNVQEGMALCRACGTLTRLADLEDQQESEAGLSEADVGHPPPGCAMRDDGLEVRIRASARSPMLAAFAGAFALLWNAFVAMFLLIAIASTIHLIAGAVPAWFPVPAGGKPGNIGPNMPLWQTLFVWLFLTPFFLIGVIMAWVALQALFGRVEARVRPDSAWVFSGFGPIGTRQRFDPARVRRVSLGWLDEHTRRVIVIEGDETVRAGSSLSDGRRKWMAAALRRVLLGKRRVPPPAGAPVLR